MNYEQIVKEIWPELYRFAYYKVQNKEEAEEITQETLGKVYQKLLQEKVDLNKIKAYCFTAAHNIIVDLWRKKSRRPKETQLDGALDYITGIPDKQKEIEDKLMVRKALEQLPQQAKQVLILRIVEGYSIQEVADKLGKTPGSIKSMQFRALKSLKAILEEGGYLFE